MLSIIAAVADNRVIGRGGALPWRLPGDLAHFMRTTMGRPVIMGRKTFQSLDGPLPGRINIVITHSPPHSDFRAEGVWIAHSLDEAIDKALTADSSGEVFILGGAEIYRQALPRVQCMHITHVHARPEGDTFFPEFDPSEWTVTEERRHEPDERNEHAFTIRRYVRVC